MAIYHHSTKICKSTTGSSACQQAAYQAAEKIKALKSNKVYDYTTKSGVDFTEIIAPVEIKGVNKWIGNRSQLWNTVELNEKRADAQFARQLTIAIPIELSQNEQIALVREYVKQSYVNRGMIADIAIHNLQSNNPHAHVMLTMRALTIDKDGMAEFGLKNREWNNKDLAIEHRKNWEILTNQYLARAGCDTRIDCRTLAEQGIDRIPQIHLGRAVIEMQQRGKSTERGSEFDRIERVNEEIKRRLEEIYSNHTILNDLHHQINFTEIRAVEEWEKKEEAARTQTQLDELTKLRDLKIEALNRDKSTANMLFWRDRIKMQSLDTIYYQEIERIHRQYKHERADITGEEIAFVEPSTAPKVNRVLVASEAIEILQTSTQTSEIVTNLDIEDIFQTPDRVVEAVNNLGNKPKITKAQSTQRRRI